jgi:kumamolisin
VALRAARATLLASIFVATGDSGAYDCQSKDLKEHNLTVDWPSSRENAIAVGGTRLDLSSTGSYHGETGWEGSLSNSGGGGGFSTTVGRPSWQSGLSSSYSNDKRALPDVSAAADPATGWLNYTAPDTRHEGEKHEHARCEITGGTSAATPFWAAATLLVKQYALSQHAGALPFMDPVFYAIAAAPQPYAPFHDVTEGGNRFYQAAPGWDPATGLGSPDVYNLARDVVSYLRAHQLR